MEMGMGKIESGINKPRQINQVNNMGEREQKIIDQILDSVSVQSRPALRELIEASGDRELIGQLFHMSNLINQRKRLYLEYAQAPAKKKIEISQKLLAKWDEIESAAGLMDKKIATILLQSIDKTLKTRQ